jgi:hypothetical protein
MDQFRITSAKDKVHIPVQTVRSSRKNIGFKRKAVVHGDLFAFELRVQIEEKIVKDPERVGAVLFEYRLEMALIPVAWIMDKIPAHEPLQKNGMDPLTVAADEVFDLHATPPSSKQKLKTPEMVFDMIG